MRGKVAVIGAGVSGLTAAYLLQRRYEVMLFEADVRLGGHAHTHDLPTPGGGYTAVDSGFIVHNERTYPNLIRLFRELGVPTQDSEMSMSVRCDGCGLEYAGSKRLPGLFAQRANLVRGQYLRMLAEVTRFHRHARRVMADERAGDVTLGAFLAVGGYSTYFTRHFMAPVVSAVWSAGESVSLDYPARYLFTFLANHGMLSVGGSPQWKTVVGGSRRYVERAAKGLSAVEVSTPIRAVSRTSGGVAIRDDADQTYEVDKVVIATHADQALRLLASPSSAEREVLGAFQYSRNETWLHSDPSVLPVSSGARASWNYLKTSCPDGGGPVLVSYDMNRLMRLNSPVGYVVTLNATDRVAPDSVLAKMVYEHPIYTPSALAAQRKLPALNDGTVAYAGAYHGWGFHEDGCAAGVRAAESLGVTW
ncbi:NAD(P)/FAD-dependent oxidoreductase [Kutzneria sp. CA-103260]|uniref:NAD(P)/FAD-dependent oxidoreductase n=1 Tax=Kutzneria sp. CA-103260 TaxID=2802641 RepID=UPI001BADA699|nr:FAD-dependent oxidoreductase [Kutzneria sp. CA-103260]QUQ66138.1 amine oxidase [Kutzneria sp. CA-103260]